ncbi:MAG: 4'-phosphopantetheinyl transferase superfamily protein [Ruminococcaceae bacterium]|nr:4'-phosphopantetheinyl transferase superfamily protein [Oscillospiraceae bacterium]
MLKLYKSDILDGESDHDASQRLIRLCAKELCAVDAPVVLKGESGKPYFADLPIKFSASHSGGRVILAVSDREIGADIQKVNPRSVRVAKRFFTERECEYVGDNCERFFEIWTKKEAYAKWHGKGLAATMEVDVTKLEFYTETDCDYVIAVYEKVN